MAEFRLNGPSWKLLTAIVTVIIGGWLSWMSLSLIGLGKEVESLKVLAQSTDTVTGEIHEDLADACDKLNGVDRRIVAIESNRFTSEHGKEVWTALNSKADKDEVPPAWLETMVRTNARHIEDMGSQLGEIKALLQENRNSMEILLKVIDPNG